MPRPQFRLRTLFILTAAVAVACRIGSREVPNGEIIHVNQKSGFVWINVGQADGLQREVMFSVVGDEDVGKGQPTKGRILVTELLGPHFAECRILDDTISDPLLPGDKIFTLLWRPGCSTGFAIAGIFDLNGDGEDDRPMIIDLIHMAGGRVDAQVPVKDDEEKGWKKGKQTGKLNINTRYLAMGDPPDDADIQGDFFKIQKEAQQFGVKIVPIDDFLDLVGWMDAKQTPKFGSRKGNGAGGGQ